jgi:pimeloyl-ACP methyl ester carboxylesterase
MPLDRWLAQADRWPQHRSPAGDGWVREFLRAGVVVDADGVARARFRFENHMQVVDALYDQRPSSLYARVACPVLLLPAGSDEFATLKRPAVDLAADRLPDARVVWFEDTVHDIPLQRPAALAAELARFAAEVTG